MAFPHPKARNHNYGQEDKPRSRGVLRKLFKGTVNITNNRNPKDDVDTAKDGTLGVVIH